MPEALESRWANRGLTHLRNNMVGARMILEGCAAGDNQGFDDRLEAAGAGALAARMRTLLNNVDAAANAIPNGNLTTALANDRPAVQRLYDALKALTDFLKNEFSAALQITSARLEGDND
ncbi:MAG: imelysin family protein [Polyangiales bacterium]